MDSPLLPILTRHSFTSAEWDGVQAFDCGDAHYEREVATWIKGKQGPEIDSALTSIYHPDRPGRVWLYKLEDGTLVGFGALGQNEWRWKGKKDPFVPVTIIIWVGLQKEFQGKPEGPKEQRYSVLILNDLIKEAEKDQDKYPVLGLCVHKDNAKAINLYKWFGFADNLEPRRNPKTKEVEYLRMAVVLNEEVLLRLRDQAQKKQE